MIPLRPLTTALLGMLLSPGLMAQAPPTRKVSGDTLVSLAEPAATFVFDRAFHYAGAQTIDILKVAGAEQYFFIDAAAGHTIRRFYWIQFEHFYPGNTHTYNYSGIKDQNPVSLGRLAFVGDVRIIPYYFTDDDRPGSDSKATADFLLAKGFNIEGTFASLRLFHLPDSTRRRELMIIYGEIVPVGVPGAKLRTEIAGHAQAFVRVLPRK